MNKLYVPLLIIFCINNIHHNRYEIVGIFMQYTLKVYIIIVCLNIGYA